MPGPNELGDFLRTRRARLRPADVALRLNEEEDTHLYALANHAAGRTARGSPASRVVRPGIRQLLETVRPCPAYVLTRTRELFADWDRSAETIAAHLRKLAADTPGDPDVSALIAELLDGSPEFTRLWQRHDVRQRRGEAKAFRHPQAGEFTLTNEVLYLADGQRMSVYQAGPGRRDHDALTLLSMIASGGPGQDAVPVRRAGQGSGSAGSGGSAGSSGM